MANETKVSSLVTVAAYIDANIAPVLRAATVTMGIVYQTQFESGSSSKKLRKRTAQSAAIVADAAAASNAEYVISAGNTLTQQKAVVLNEISEEAQKFGGLNLQEVTSEQGLAIADKIDTDLLALFAGFSNNVGSTGVDLTIANMISASYTVRAANAGGPLVYVLHPIQHYDIQNAIVASTAPVWSVPQNIELLGGQPLPNGYVGKFFGIDVFVSSNCATANSGADRVGACFNPKLALAMGVGGSVETMVDIDATKRTTLINSAFYYDVKEYLDGAGCAITTDA